MSQLNTHAYDGKLAVDEGLRELSKTAVDVAILTQVLVSIRKYVNESMPLNQPAIEASLRQLENDRTNNWDAQDQLHAEHLLIIIWQRLQVLQNENPTDSSAYYKYLMEQLADIQNGSCAEGRVKRLFQVYCALPTC
jgi:hypothetical protein